MAVLRPDGPNVFIAGELAALSLHERFIECRLFLRGETKRGLIHTGEMQKPCASSSCIASGMTRTVSTACSSNLAITYTYQRLNFNQPSQD